MLRPMKDTHVPWVGNIPRAWALVRVKDVSPVNRGASPRPIDDEIYFDDHGEYAWVRISDVSASAGFLESTTQRLSKLGEAKSVKRQPGDLFLSIAGTVGKACITNIKACIHDGFVYFPRMNDQATKSFFFYLFNSGLAYDGLGKLGTQLNLNTETVGNILVPLPPITEQATIADYLLKQTTRIDKRRELLAKKRELLIELRKALVHENVCRSPKQDAVLTSCKLVRIKDAVSINPATFLPRTGEVEFYPMDAIGVDGGLTAGQFKSVADAGGYSQFKNGDVLFAKVTPCFENGKSAIAQVLTTKAALATTEVTVLRPNQTISPDFLHYRLKGRDFADMGESEMKGAGGLKRVPEKHVANFRIALPSKGEQKTIVDFLDRKLSQIARQITLIDQLDDLLQQQRKAIIHEAVTGKIDLSNYKPSAT